MPFLSRSGAAKPWHLMAFALPFSLLLMPTQAQQPAETQAPAQAQQPAQAQAAAEGQPSASTSEWESGEQLYEKVCGHCHSPEVGVGTVLAGRELPAIYVQAIVRSGLNAMPAFPASFIDDEALALVAEYLATLPPPAAQL